MPILKAEDVEAALKKGGSARVDVEIAPRFKVGDPVITRNINPPGHTRLPRYARRRRGEIAIAHGVFVFPDSNAAGEGQNPQHLYSVRFTARELWGAEASAVDAVHLDLFDDYLDPA